MSTKFKRILFDYDGTILMHNNEEEGIRVAEALGLDEEQIKIFADQLMDFFANQKFYYKGKKVTVIGRSMVVGKPLAMLLLNDHATVTICHSRTVDLPKVAQEAEILIAAVGRAKMVNADFVRQGQVVIDVGINRTEQGLCGDVDFDSVKNKASYITPVPGGVGPMTIAMLLENTYLSAVRASKK